MGKPTEEDICAILKEEGWKEFKNPFSVTTRTLFKRFSTPTRCFQNDDKPGIQVRISVSDLSGDVAYELEITGMLSDNTWITIHQYSMPNNVLEGLKVIPRMLAMWELAANDKHVQNNKN